MPGFFDEKPPSQLTDLEKIEWWKQKRRDERWSSFIVFVFMILLVGALLGAAMLHAEWVYGDWHCALAKCRIVKVKPEK